jgi:lysophospholipase L1-like esterase
MRPLTVVWVYFAGNDLVKPRASPRRSDLSRELRSPLLRPYLENASYSQNLRTNAALVDADLKAGLAPILRARREVPWALALFRQAGHVALSQGLVLYALDLLNTQRAADEAPTTTGPPEEKNLMAVFGNIMGSVREAAERDGFNVIFVMLPDKSSCVDNIVPDLNPAVRQLALDLRFRLVDPFEHFGGDRCRASLFATAGPHLTPAGNKAVAEALLAELADR